MNINHTQAIERTADFYFGFESLVPAIENSRFSKFAAGVFAFIDEVLPKNEVKKLIFRIDENAPAAMFSREGSSPVITLPVWYFTKSGLLETVDENLEGELKFLALALINGSTIHEALHVKYSQLPNELRHESHEYRMLMRDYREATHVANNIIEDIFIEAQLNGKLAKMTETKNMAFFTAASLKDAYAEFEADPGFRTACNVAMHYKNPQLRETEEFKKFDGTLILENATEVSASFTHSRVPLVAKFLKLFPPSAEEIKEAGDSSGSNFLGGPDGDIPEHLAKAIEKAIKSSKKDSAETTKIAKEAVEGGREELAKLGGQRTDHDEYSPVAALVELDIMDCKTVASRTLEVTKPWSLAAQMRTVNHTPGVARTSGNTLVSTRIHRIATDSKIMAFQEKVVKTGKNFEIIILVDASGSMGTDLMRKASQAAKDIFMAARKAQIPCSVFAQTSKGGRYVPLLARVAAFKMGSPTRNIDRRFNQLFNMEKKENFDGYAIEAVVKHFSKGNSEKILLVLSDGAPCGPGYWGDSADSHTRKVVEQARKSRIKVSSLSLIEYVMDNNNRIYGRGSNFNASHDLQQTMRQVFLNSVI